MQTQEQNRALENAQGWAQTIEELYEAFQFCNDQNTEARDISREARKLLRQNFEYDGDNRQQCLEAIEEHLRESVLSVEVRSGWQSAGEPLEPQQFSILLSTGGPALRIVGDFGQYATPRRCWLEHQDWFTPWAEARCGNSDALLWFASLFYYGEG